MKNFSFIIFLGIALLASGCTLSKYKMTEYKPLSKADCLKYKNELGLQYCPYDNDHLAGVAMACGHIKNIPTGEDLHILAKDIYSQWQTRETSIYGNRNDVKLKALGLYVNDSHIYYWTGEEAKDGVGGYVRMFATKGSIPYYVPRDGSGYFSQQLGKINYGETKNIVTSRKHDSNLVGLPNNDALVALCYRGDYKKKRALKF